MKNSATEPQVRSTFDARPPRFAQTTREQWGSWHWQHQNRLRRPEDFTGVLELTSEELRAFAEGAHRFRVAVTPHYAALMKTGDPDCPVRLQALPRPEELQEYPFEKNDPLAEEEFMPVPGLTHRYPDRALLYVSHHCPVYCRHCTRKRKVSNPTTAASKDQILVGIDYIAATPAIRDVIISGGDPLTLSDERLDSILNRLRKIDHLDVIRLGTRNPVTLPQRITESLASILSRHRPIYVHTHFNHPAELSAESTLALDRLLGAGCVLGNQMVLLRGVNDDVEAIMKLNRRLLRHGCRPYYILQCDMARGITHFRTPLKTGLEIMDHLRGRIGGMGVPDFVVDLPGGGGKIELLPDYVVDRKPSEHGEVISFRNFQGKQYAFVDVDPDLGPDPGRT